jgi:hypothetical protein
MAPRNSHPLATSLHAAFNQVRTAAMKSHQISSERMAELLGVPASTYYKWIEESRMPADKLALFEHIARNHAVTRYLAHRAHLMVIDIPRGRGTDATAVQSLQATLHESVGALLAFAGSQISAEEAMERLTIGMEALAFHREDVRKHSQPELDF